MSEDSKNVRKHLKNIWNLTKSQAADALDEVIAGAQRVRDRLDERPIEDEKRELFRTLGEQTYEAYKRSRERAPQIIKESLEHLDRVTGQVVNLQNAERVNEGLERVVRRAVDGFNDFLEDRVRTKANRPTDASGSEPPRETLAEAMMRKTPPNAQHSDAPFEKEAHKSAEATTKKSASDKKKAAPKNTSTTAKSGKAKTKKNASSAKTAAKAKKAKPKTTKTSAQTKATGSKTKKAAAKKSTRMGNNPLEQVLGNDSKTKK